METIGLIGTGNMGGALIKGMLKNNVTEAGDITVFDTDAQRLAAFVADTGA